MHRLLRARGFRAILGCRATEASAPVAESSTPAAANSAPVAQSNAPVAQSNAPGAQSNAPGATSTASGRDTGTFDSSATRNARVAIARGTDRPQLTFFTREMTPMELAGLYATLADGGTYEPLRLVAGEPGARTSIFGAGAAWLTRRTLSLKDRPDFPRRRVSGLPADIHWKTGTSFGFKDAWAIGSNPAYTAVVWTGNVDNTPSTELVGSEASGPLLFDILEGLADKARGLRVETTPPSDLVAIDVCEYSGYVATDACVKRTQALAPIHAVPTAPDPYHVSYEVDRVTGHAVLPACRQPASTYDRKAFIVLPRAVAAWLAERNRAVPEPPVFAEGCIPETAAPTLLTPAVGHVVTLIPGVPSKNQLIPLTASTQSATLSWFVDGEFLGSAPAGQRLYWEPAPGKHEIVVADASGRNARRSLTVQDVR